ncbi:hypothetical protein HUN59_05135 [Curtobacterium sp. Csp2]|uniref:hypothetical protein n=1 Tax=Curtobacterium sp. Csp2 TaxID=2495430 RepID=UPI001580F4E6|nr:hypothetical protein [Curtobacterium sp. Csp2]QKS15681.1 hypothetical protein HUN59_05135 [Curtobacterium sp. Csp2]
MVDVVDGGNATSTFTDTLDGGNAFTIYGPGLVPVPSMDPVPHVEITLDTVVPGTVTATLYRIQDDRTMRVRGLVNVPAAGGFGGIDTEPPLQQTVSYRAEYFDVNGVSLGFGETSDTYVDYAGTVIHQPIDPSRGVSVLLAQGAAKTLSRPFEGEVIKPIGRSVPVYIGTGRSGLEDINVDCVTFTAEDAARMSSVFGGYDGDEQLPVVCFRSSLPTGLPAVMFMVVPKPAAEPYAYAGGEEAVMWRLSGQEVAPPVEGIVRPLLAYSSLENAYATYADIEGAYLTYLDAETDFDLAGA